VRACSCPGASAGWPCAASAGSEVAARQGGGGEESRGAERRGSESRGPERRLPDRTVATNRRARHDYSIEETFEAGLVLTGPEVKSLRAGRATLSDAFARVDPPGTAVWLGNVHIP